MKLHESLALIFLTIGSLGLNHNAQGADKTPTASKPKAALCKVHHVALQKRTVPIAYGMIPMSRVEAEQGEWKRRMTQYPNPGDCLPATGINFTGETKAFVDVCPKCEVAKKKIDALQKTNQNQAQNTAKMLAAAKPKTALCKFHRVPMTKRTVPIAYGMIPLNRFSAESRELERREKMYPNPGDCLPATSINFTGETQAEVDVCPKCEAAQKADAPQKARPSD